MEDIPEEPWSDWKFQDMCNKWTHFGWFCIPQHFWTIRPGFRKALCGRDLKQSPTSAPHEFTGSNLAHYFVCWPIFGVSKTTRKRVNESAFGSSFMFHLQRKSHIPTPSWSNVVPKWFQMLGTCQDLPKGWPFLVPRAIHFDRGSPPSRQVHVCFCLFFNQPSILFLSESDCYLEWSKHHGRLCCFCEMRQHPISLWFRDLRMWESD